MQGLFPACGRLFQWPLGVASYGLVFGVLSRHAGMGKSDAIYMSAIVFAGASQFVALDMWTMPLPVVPLIVTTLVVNLRHVLMGAALGGQTQRLKPCSDPGLVVFSGG